MAARYAYECPKCHATVEISTTQAGQQITCGNCSAVITVPKLGAIKQLPVVGGETAALSKRPVRTSGSGLKSWLFAGGLLLAAIAGMGGAAAQYRANQFHVDVDFQKIVDAEYEAIDNAQPAEIYSIILGAGEESFSLEYKEAPYRTLNIKSGIIQKIAWVCFGLAGVGLLMLISSFLFKG